MSGCGKQESGPSFWAARSFVQTESKPITFTNLITNFENRAQKYIPIVTISLQNEIFCKIFAKSLIP